MAAPDPSTLTSADDIFSGSHTLPQIRAIHKSLHVAIDDKATRLRTQVGNSYRELLGTADTIVQMRGDNERVQEVLGGMGSRCGRTVVDAKAAGLAGFVRGQNKDKIEEAARVRLLDACVQVIGRVLKGGGGLEENVKTGDRLILAAKVLVLSRLLTKSLGSELLDPRLRRDVEASKKSLKSLRQRLNRGVDRILSIVTEDHDREDVVKALCAYSLTNSSGAKDVLRYFLYVRSEALEAALDADSAARDKPNDGVVKSLKLYTRTLLDVQAIVPAKLSQSLLALKKGALLSDSGLKQLHGLRLDTYKRWCGDEILYFTPFIRHDDLDGAQAREGLRNWAEKGGKVLLEGLKVALSRMTEFKTVMELRNNVLELWIRDGGRARGFDPSEMQDDLREVINARMLAVLESKVKKLHLVGSEVKATLETWKDGTTDQNQDLWDEDGYDVALSKGAAPFMEEVVSRLYGRNDAVSKASNCYKSWFHVIDDVKEVVNSLKGQRWDNDYDEVEDEETIEARQQALSRDDPAMLQRKLDTSLDAAFEELEKQLHDQWAERSEKSNNGTVAIYFLRVLREIRRQLPERPATAAFGLAMVHSLQETVVVSVLRKSLDYFTNNGLRDRTVISRPLWEGEPALPNQPSPSLFEFLRGLSMSMGEAGIDLWSPAAVKVMKAHLGQKLASTWREALDEVDSEELDGVEDKENDDEDDEEGKDKDQTDEKDEDKEADSEQDDSKGDLTDKGLDAKHELYTQWLFDVLYLRECLGHNQEGMESLAKSIGDKAEADEAALERLNKSAEAYWQRTNLLFGLLA